MTIKRFLVLLIVFILWINKTELFGEVLETNSNAYVIRHNNFNYLYEIEKVGRKDYKKVEKTDKAPLNYLVKTYFLFDCSGENNASDFIEDFQSTNFLFFKFTVKKLDLKIYSFALLDDNGKMLTNLSKIRYVGYNTNDNGHVFYLIVDFPKKEFLNYEKIQSVKIRLNDIVYITSFSFLANYTSLQKYVRQLEQDEITRQQEEYAYKNSDEYKQLQLQKLLNELNKNKIYDIRKDNFDSRIHVTSKRMSGKLDNNVINILNKNNLYIFPRCEINSEYGYLDFGMTITQKASLTKGSVYIKGISFSNGDESITIRTGNYGVGQIGKVININGLLDGVQMTCRLDESYVDDLYNILINAKKPVMVRVHAGEYTYDSVISDLEKNMFIDILKIKQLKDGVKN